MAFLEELEKEANRSNDFKLQDIISQWKRYEQMESRDKEQGRAGGAGYSATNRRRLKRKKQDLLSEAIKILKDKKGNSFLIRQLEHQLIQER